MVGPFEILILAFVVFLVLGPKRITSVFKALGRGAKDFTNEFGEKDKKRDLPEEEDRDTTLRKR